MSFYRNRCQSVSLFAQSSWFAASLSVSGNWKRFHNMSNNFVFTTDSVEANLKGFVLLALWLAVSMLLYGYWMCCFLMYTIILDAKCSAMILHSVNLLVCCYVPT